MTEGIKQTEKGALDFAKNVYGKALADAIFLTRPSFVISDSEGGYHFLSSYHLLWPRQTSFESYVGSTSNK